MNTTQTQTRIPSPRTGRRGIDPVDPTWKGLAYLDFLYGFGAGPGVDVGAPRDYRKVPTTHGSVYRQDFEHGVAFANFGDETALVVLDYPYFDLTNELCTSVTVAPHTVEVLLNDPS
jgi:hypothetical protein